MARHARILTSIWTTDFCDRSAAAQRLYLMAISQPTLTYAGVLPYTCRRWAGLAPDTRPGDIAKAVNELVEHRYFLVDGDTEEVWVRTYLRHEGVLWMPNSRKAMWREIGLIQSVPIQQAIRCEYPELFHQPNGNGLAKPFGEPFPDLIVEGMRERFGLPKRPPKSEGSLARDL
jgi:hypothetical protein